MTPSVEPTFTVNVTCNSLCCGRDDVIQNAEVENPAEKKEDPPKSCQDCIIV